jgi:drug/metabolite transporter (DMT)-like permease
VRVVGVRVMSRSAVLLMTSFAMIAFAGNSLLCRLALKDTGIDAATFTLVRLASGAAALWLLARRGDRASLREGNWPSALALFIYAAAFSFAYLSLTAATGALLLFGAVQATMIGYGLFMGERLSAAQIAGLICACGGLVYLMLPGVAAPPLYGAGLMIIAGVAWGVYSLRGKGAGDPTRVTAGNFLRAVPLGVALSAMMLTRASVDAEGVSYAIASGALTSGLGYAIWYTAVRELKATSAATVQLSVPLLAALGGVAILGEAITWRLVFATLAILGGIAMVILHDTAPRSRTTPIAGDSDARHS